ncbi:SCO3242 family prenyltransferase [Streptomyces hawaiiensis]|uniref:SCO3242 family prenyltransferase n=1 Tax=Streptomyces hawaiiensis TaxID=67305 RepID=UPI003651956E
MTPRESPCGCPDGASTAAPEGTAADTAARACTGRSRRRRAWAELLRLPALFSVPGDALAGTAATGSAPNSRTLLAIGASLCLYEAGMALNDWADRDVDAVERPHRPLPSGRIRPTTAFTAACALTGAGLALAARAGRPALAVAAPLAATVWGYDLGLKHTPAGPVAMGAARGLDLLMGAAATTGRTRPALPSAALLGTHTLAVTTVSRQEARGGSPLAPLAALATTALLTRLVTRRPAGLMGRPTGPMSRPAGLMCRPAGPMSRLAGLMCRPTGLMNRPAGPMSRPAAPMSRPVGLMSRPVGLMSRPVGLMSRPAGLLEGRRPATSHRPAGPRAARHPGQESAALLTTVFGAAYAATTARPYLHATLNPSPPLTQRAVAAGIRATIPLQATLSARSRGAATALLIAALAPLGAKFAKKVSVT